MGEEEADVLHFPVPTVSDERSPLLDSAEARVAAAISLTLNWPLLLAWQL